MSNFSNAIERNPLLRNVAFDIDQLGWWQRMANNPFIGEDLSACSPCTQDLLLDRFCELYVPSATVVNIAYQIHRMLVSGLIDRDPNRSENRQALYRLAECASRAVLDVPCISTSTRGMLIQGVTKQGKTTLLRRVLSQYPQVIRRSADQDAGWLHLDQLLYLVIPMPTDASKAGFLMQAFIELDKALGTNYAQETTIRDSSIDAQLVQFLAKLAVHRCGLLVVEEAQESNALSRSRFGRDFSTFFLRVLNTGIPTILIGNPLAFEELETNSQLMSRLSDPGRHELKPCNSASSKEWVSDLVPGIWGTNILPEPDEPLPDRDKSLMKWTGGFKHYMCVLRRETLRAAVQRKARFVSMRDIESALLTPVMIEGQKITRSYWSGANSGETDYVDIPGTPSPKVQSARGKRSRGAR
jgi:hypothetical protein